VEVVGGNAAISITKQRHLSATATGSSSVAKLIAVFAVR